MQVSKKISVPVLTYHSIDASGSVISTAPATFRRQMRFLAENGFRGVPLEKVVDVLLADDSLPPKTVAVTFDDGFRNFYEQAFPVLEKYDFGATVFLVTDFCGKKNDWAGNPPGLPRAALMSWREIGELSRKGIRFGSHTRTHPDLAKLEAGKINSEVVDSKTEIEDRLGREATTFAYPYGSFNLLSRQIVAENFKAACSTTLGTVAETSDLLALERLDTYYLSNAHVFNRLSSPSFDLYIRLRRVLRDVKAFLH